MNLSREETLRQEGSSFREIAEEGGEGLQHGHVNDPDGPAGLKDGATDHHITPDSLQESDPQTWPFLNPPCPPSPVEADPVNHTSVKRHYCLSIPPEDGETSAKRRNDSPESPKRKRKDAPASEPEKAKGENNADLWNCISNNHDVNWVENILGFIEANYLNTIEKILLLNDERSIFGNVKDTFFELLAPEERVEYILNKRKKAYCQHAFVLLKYKQRESKSDNEYVIDIKGSYKPKCKGKKHSEDFIIKDIEPLINDDLLEIWIYTLNNPCLARKNHTPCMYNLIKFSQKYPNIQFYIGFSKYYIFISKITRYIEQAGKKITFDTRFRITSKSSDSVVSVENDKEQNEEEAETSAKLQSTQGEKMQERNEDEEIISENEEDLSVGKELNQCVVLAFLKDFQDRYSNLRFFHLKFEQWLNLGNSANLDNSANLANSANSANLTNEE